MSKQYFEKLDTDKLAELERQALKLEKTELESVNLSVVGDAEKLASGVKQFRAAGEKVIDKYSGDLGSLEGTVNALEQIINNVVKKMSDADKEVNTLRNQGQRIVTTLTDGMRFLEELENTMTKLEKSSKDLGIKVDDISVYKELVKQSNGLGGLIDYSTKRMGIARDAIDRAKEVSLKINKINSIQ